MTQVLLAFTFSAIFSWLYLHITDKFKRKQVAKDRDVALLLAATQAQNEELRMTLAHSVKQYTELLTQVHEEKRDSVH